MRLPGIKVRCPICLDGFYFSVDDDGDDDDEEDDEEEDEDNDGNEDDSGGEGGVANGHGDAKSSDKDSDQQQAIAKGEAIEDQHIGGSVVPPGSVATAATDMEVDSLDRKSEDSNGQGKTQKSPASAAAPRRKLSPPSGAAAAAAASSLPMISAKKQRHARAIRAKAMDQLASAGGAVLLGDAHCVRIRCCFAWFHVRLEEEEEEEEE